MVRNLNQETASNSRIPSKTILTVNKINQMYSFHSLGLDKLTFLSSTAIISHQIKIKNSIAMLSHPHYRAFTRYLLSHRGDFFVVNTRNLNKIPSILDIWKLTLDNNLKLLIFQSKFSGARKFFFELFIVYDAFYKYIEAIRNVPKLYSLIKEGYFKI